MKKIIAFLLLIPFFCNAQDWSLIGPDTANVNEFFVSFLSGKEVICSNSGIYIWNDTGTGWDLCTYGLPVKDADDLNDSTLLIAMGNGSYSDGIYKFDLVNKQFEVIMWTMRPESIYRYNDSLFLTAEGGVYKSANGLSWEAVSGLSNKYCRAITSRGSHLVVSRVDDPTELYLSGDYGNTWSAAAGVPVNIAIPDMSFDPSDILYIVYSGDSWSSGLCSSANYGDSPVTEFYSVGIGAVLCMNDYVYVGWSGDYEMMGDTGGVAIWDPGLEEVFYLVSPPNPRINRITTHPLIDCVNIVCCTDSGTYVTCNPFVSIEDISSGRQDNIKVFPNPAYREANVIIAGTAGNELVNVVLYDVVGNAVDCIFSKQKTEKGLKINIKRNNLPSGIYLLRIETGSGIRSGRIVFK